MKHAIFTSLTIVRFNYEPDFRERQTLALIEYVRYDRAFTNKLFRENVSVEQVKAISRSHHILKIVSNFIFDSHTLIQSFTDSRLPDNPYGC